MTKAEQLAKQCFFNGCVAGFIIGYCTNEIVGFVVAVYF